MGGGLLQIIKVTLLSWPSSKPLSVGVLKLYLRNCAFQSFFRFLYMLFLFKVFGHRSTDALDCISDFIANLSIDPIRLLF